MATFVTDPFQVTSADGVYFAMRGPARVGKPMEREAAEWLCQLLNEAKLDGYRVAADNEER